MDVFGGIVLILSGWALLSLLFFTVGWVVQLLFQLVPDESILTLRPFWLGWGTVIALLQIWHLFWPVNLHVYLLTAVLAGISVPLAWGPLKRAFRLKRSQWIFLLLVAPVLAYLALGLVGPYDAGLYHLASIKWARSYPAVPGLGNLHGRLAFNSSYFLYQAFLDLFPVAAGYNLAAGLLGVALCAELLVRVVKRGAHIVIKALSWLLIGPSVLLAIQHASSTSPDWPVFVLGCLVGLYTTDLLYRHCTVKEKWVDILFIVFLAALGITIKLSFAALGLFLIGGAIAFLLHEQWKRPIWPAPRQLLFLATPLLLLLGWVLHGYTLSGYPAYPSTIGGIDFPWQVPPAEVIEEAKWVSSWARWPERHYGEVLGESKWFVPWLQRVSKKIDLFTFPVITAAVGIMLGGILHSRASRGERWRALFLLLPLVGATGSWFIVAPEPRFAGATLYLLAAVLVALGCSWLHPRRRRLTLFLLVLPWAFLVLRPGWRQARQAIDPFTSPPSVELEQSAISANVVVWSPVEGDQCWDAPLPCRPRYPLDGTLLWQPPGEDNWGFHVVAGQREGVGDADAG